MGGLIGGGKMPMSGMDNRLTGLQIQKTGYGVTLPVVIGTQRVQPVLLWYGNFVATPHTSQTGGGGKGGGGGGATTTTYTYTAGVVFALAHGPVSTVSNRMWRDKSKFETISNPARTVSVINEGHAGNAPYSFAVNAGFMVDRGVRRTPLNTALRKVTGTPTAGTYSQSGNVYTIGGIGAIGVKVNYDYAAPASITTAAEQAGLTEFTGSIGQAGWGWLQTFAPAEYVNYSGIAYVAAPVYDLTASATLGNHAFEVVGFGTLTNGTDVHPADALLLVSDGNYGAGFSAIDTSQQWRDYCQANGLWLSVAADTQLSAADRLRKLAMLTNSEIIWSAGAVKFIPRGDATVTGNGVTYTPNLTASYNLTDDDYLSLPTVQRKRKSDAFNHIRVEWLNRGQDYAVSIAEAKDAESIERFGVRSAPILQAHEICLQPVAEQVAQAELNRALYLLNQYQLTVDLRYSRLEPMDIITLTDSGLGLNQRPVRVLEVSETEDGLIDLLCEELPAGIGQPAPITGAAGAGYNPNQAVTPGAITWR